MKKPLKPKKMKNENLLSHENTAENRNLEMARYIWSILKTQLTIIMSWGIDLDSIRVVNLGIQFHVQGFKHTGYVKVVLNEGKDLFEVSLLSGNGECVKFLASSVPAELKATPSYCQPQPRSLSTSA